MSLTFPLTELQEISTKKFISKIIAVQEIQEITGNVVCLDVTNIVRDTMLTSNPYFKYYLIPIHSKEYINKLYHSISLRQLSHEKEKKMLADTFYDTLVRYCTNKYLFEYFKIVAVDDGVITTTYENASDLVNDVAYKIFEIGSVESNKLATNNVPNIYDSKLTSVTAMQFKGFNEHEIRDWTKNITNVIIDPFIRNDTGVKQMTLVIGRQHFHVLINNYVVKISDTGCMILSENVFESIYFKSQNAIAEFYYGSDTTDVIPVDSDDITQGVANKASVVVTPRSSFDIEVKAGDTRVVFAYPERYPDVKSIIRLDYHGDNDYVDIFEKVIVPVVPNAGTSEEIDYNVYVWVVNEPFAADMKFKVIF